MKNIIEPKTLPGFMELNPDDQILFNRIKGIILETYEKYGFWPLDTPIIEYSDVLLAKAGGETEKQIYRFNKGENDLSLRFDLTVTKNWFRPCALAHKFFENLKAIYCRHSAKVI